MSVDFRYASINVCYVSPVFCHPISQIDRFTNIIVGTSFTGQNINTIFGAAVNTVINIPNDPTPPDTGPWRPDIMRGLPI